MARTSGKMRNGEGCADETRRRFLSYVAAGGAAVSTLGAVPFAEVIEEAYAAESGDKVAKFCLEAGARSQDTARFLLKADKSAQLIDAYLRSMGFEPLVEHSAAVRGLEVRHGGQASVVLPYRGPKMQGAMAGAGLGLMLGNDGKPHLHPADAFVAVYRSAADSHIPGAVRWLADSGIVIRGYVGRPPRRSADPHPNASHAATLLERADTKRAKGLQIVMLTADQLNSTSSFDLAKMLSGQPPNLTSERSPISIVTYMGMNMALDPPTGFPGGSEAAVQTFLNNASFLTKAVDMIAVAGGSEYRPVAVRPVRPSGCSSTQQYCLCCCLCCCV